jgi:hypothetical protein
MDYPTMKHNRYVLWTWRSSSDEIEIDWVGAAQHLGAEFAGWIRRLDPVRARYYLYRKNCDYQLVLEVFDPIIDQEYQTRSQLAGSA